MNGTTVMHVGGLHWATSTASVQATLLRRPGVESVEANAAPGDRRAVHVGFESDRGGQRADAQATTPAHTVRSRGARNRNARIDSRMTSDLDTRR